MLLRLRQVHGTLLFTVDYLEYLFYANKYGICYINGRVVSAVPYMTMCRVGCFYFFNFAVFFVCDGIKFGVIKRSW